MQYFYLIILSITLKWCKSIPTYTIPINFKMTLNNDTNFNSNDFNITAYLNDDHIKKICNSRDAICKANFTKICGMRKVNESKYEFKDFDNSCYLFLSNICDNPGNEYHIADSQSCSPQLTRRHFVDSGVTVNAPEATPLPDKEASNTTLSADGTLGQDYNTTAGFLREGTFSTLYDIKTAYDRHPCAQSCPNIYRPACLNVNTRHGKYFKIFTFSSHCEADRFYCMHWKEFEIPPGKPRAEIRISFLDYSFCGSQRYLNFMYTAQATSSMGHYGWLDGDDRYSKLLEPWQRKPGYG